jgi:hypothetical protein
MNYLRSRVLLLWTALIMMNAPLSVAQVFTASLSGLVTDPADAAVPGANVKIRNIETNDVRQTVTSSDGRYIFSQLKPGSYEVTMEGKGFKRFVQPSLTLVASQAGEFNVKLVIGDATQSIEVAAEAPVLDTQSANKSATLSERAVRELPTNMRNPLVLVWATAGVVAVRTGISQATQDQNHDRFALNGGRDESAAILIDGVPSQSGDWGGALATPSVDAVQEVQVTRTTFDAQYGQTDGGVVSVVTKGGSDQFHGAAFDFLRNSVLDANTWDNDRAHVAKPIFQRHQFGGGVGGPILKRKHLYFYGNYEGLRLGTPSSTLVNLPTAAERSGDFSQTFNANGTLSTIYNPFTTRPDPSGSGLIRDPFPDNVIPKSLQDPVGSKVVNLWPAANLPGNALTHALNYAKGGKTIGVNDRIDARIDWAKSEHFSVFGRVTKAWEKDIAPVLFGNGFDNNFSDQNPRHQVVIGATVVPNPTWVTNILIGTGRWREDQDSPSKGLDGTAIGLPASLVSQFAAQTIPQFVISNYPQISNNRFLNDPRTSDNLQVNNSKQLHNHTIKFGFMAMAQQVNSTDVRSAEFDFNRGMTAGPAATTDSTTTGNAVASLLLGTGSGGNAPNNARLALTEKSFAVYVQDTWRIGRKLTLDYGVRYEVQRPATERYDRLNDFDFNATNPLSQSTGLNLKGGLVFATSGNRGLWDQDSKNVAPRIGLSYKITDKLVVRSGYGIYFPPAWAGALASDGYSTTTSWVSSVGGAGLQPLNLLSNPFPQGLVAPAGSSQGLATLVGQTVNAFQRSRPSPYVQAYTLDFQYQISGNTMVEVGYTGTQGRKLFYGYSQNLNQLDPKYLSLGSALNQAVKNPFAGVIQNGPLSAATIPQYQLLLPYPQFQQVNLHTFTPGASSSFNALAVKVNRRFDNGLMVLASYQFSKAIDNASETQAWEISDLPRNIYNTSGERSISAHDVPQSFTASMVYELPVGKGRAHFNQMNRVVNAVLGGWQVSTIVRAGSGLPLQFTAPNSLAPYGYVVGRPNVTSISDLTSGTQSPDHWFNTAAVSGAPANTIGTVPRWVSGLRHGKLESADLALMKSFQPLEWLRMQFRAEAFNLPNTPQYGKANTTFGAPTFGVITGTIYTTPRNIQFSMRLSF